MSVIFTFDENKAVSADNGGYITAGGYYKGVISSFIYGKARESNAKFIEFSFESTDGEKAQYIRIFYKKQDGLDDSRVNKIHSLAGILRSGQFTAVQRRIGNDIQYFCPEAEGKPIGIVLQREDYRNSDGDIKYRLNLLHFVDYNTDKTYTELRDNLEAKKAFAKVNDKLIEDDDKYKDKDKDKKQNNIDDDDLPF